MSDHEGSIPALVQIKKAIIMKNNIDDFWFKSELPKKLKESYESLDDEQQSIIYESRDFIYKLLNYYKEVVQFPSNSKVVRLEDMSKTGRLELFLQEDGDVCVVTHSPNDYFNGIEFCTIGMGGGKSPHTLKALKNLMVAMEKDNLENPIQR